MSTECCIWKGSIDKNGYGRAKDANLAHRISFCRYNQLELKMIEGRVVMHTCDNPPCIEPEHLVLGTMTDNNADMDAKGRRVLNLDNLLLGETKKLSDEIRFHIKTVYVKGSKTHSLRVLAKEYNVSHVTIANIIKE